MTRQRTSMRYISDDNDKSRDLIDRPVFARLDRHQGKSNEERDVTSS